MVSLRIWRKKNLKTFKRTKKLFIIRIIIHLYKLVEPVFGIYESCLVIDYSYLKVIL